MPDATVEKYMAAGMTSPTIFPTKIPEVQKARLRCQAEQEHSPHIRFASTASFRCSRISTMEKATQKKRPQQPIVCITRNKNYCKTGATCHQKPVSRKTEKIQQANNSKYH
eukprot:65776-Amphidinium_carterae.2